MSEQLLAAAPGAVDGFRRPRADRTPWLLALVAFVVYATYSVTRQRTGYASAYDLGIFTQTVEKYAHLQAPDVAIKLNWNELGDHFSPVLVLLAPFYRLVPSPTTLLVAQAGLTAVSVVPITRCAAALLGRRPAVLVGLAYAGSYGLQSMIAFDFHEVAFALPLLAFGLERYLRGDYGIAAVLVGLLAFVKEDLGITVLLFAVLLFGHRRRLAIGLGTWAVAWFFIATAVVIPALNSEHTYRYFSHFLHNGALSGTSPWRVVQLAFSDGRPHLLLMLVLTGVFVVLRSPLVLLTLGTLSWRLLSVGPGYMTTHAHYDAVLMPIVFLAALDGLARLGPTAWRPRLIASYPWAAVMVMVVATAVAYPFPQMLHPRFFKDNARVAAVATLMHHVPRGVPIRTDNHLATEVVSRNQTYLLYATRPNLPVTQWVITDLSVSSLNAPLSWKLAYLKALAPYAVAIWTVGKVELVELDQARHPPAG